MKRAMEVMVWFYENCNHFLTLIQDEDGDGDGDDEDDSNEGENEEELEQRPRYNEERPIFEDLFSLGDERPGLSYQTKSPSFTEGRTALKVEPSSLREGHHPFKEEPLSFQEPTFLRGVPLGESRKTVLPEEPDLLLPEEIYSTASQV